MHVVLIEKRLSVENSDLKACNATAKRGHVYFRVSVGMDLRFMITRDGRVFGVHRDRSIDWKAPYGHIDDMYQRNWGYNPPERIEGDGETG